MLAQFYPPTVGGEERHVHSLSHALVDRGHEVAVATLAQPDLPELEDERGVRVHRLRGLTQRMGWLFSDPGRTHVPPFPDPALLAGLRAVLDRERPDVVHAHNWLLHSYLPLKRQSGAPLLVTLHDYSLACAKKRLMFRGAHCSGPGFPKCFECTSGHYGPLKGGVTTLGLWAMAAVERQAVDLFMPVSHATAAGNGLPGSGLAYEVVPNFIPDDLVSARDAADSRLGELPDGDFLLFVGDLSGEKGVPVLLEAYSRLSGAPPLVLIGRPLPDTPTKLPPNVRLFTSWPHATILEAWRRCTIALAPSTWPEPCGTVVLEAMASGRPVIASSIGGMTDLVANGETGLLVQPGDRDSLQCALQRLLHDPTLRLQMGQAGSERVKMFQAGSVVPRIEAIYQRLRDTRLDRVPSRPSHQPRPTELTP
jgi:glycosyltransferase involved in cell wall biosynthesis